MRGLSRRDALSGAAAALAGLALGPRARASAGAGAPRYPETPARPVRDVYPGGIEAIDPYRWMEDLEDPAVRAWFEAQDAAARGWLDARPLDARIARSIARHDVAGDEVRRVRLAGGRAVYLKARPGEARARLYARGRADGVERMLLDPAAAGDDASILWHQPSPDGERIAVCVAAPGSAPGLRILDVRNGVLGPVVVADPAGGAIAWGADGTWLAYTRAGADGRAEGVFRRIVGDAAGDDAALIAADAPGSFAFADDEFPALLPLHGGPLVFAAVYSGSDFAFAIKTCPADLLGGPRAAWTDVASREDGVVAVEARSGELFLLSRKRAGRFEILATSLAAPDLGAARTAVPESGRVIVAMAAASDGLYFAEREDGAARLCRLTPETGERVEIPVPEQASLRGPIADPREPGALIAVETWFAPAEWREVAPQGAQPFPLGETAAPDASTYAAELRFAVSFDGARIPLSIVRRRDVEPDGARPVWLMAYGAYGIAQEPRFLRGLLAHVEAGGVYAVAHVRGGGEYGAAWHDAGRLARKPDAARDLVACAEALVAEGWCGPRTLAIEGESGGGPTVGLAAVARPDLFAAVFLKRADCNVLRLAATPDGELPTEFGTTATADGAAALLAADVTQAVRPSVRYPAFLLSAGWRDVSVPPWQVGKLAAHLQRAAPDGAPVLMRTDFEGGHLTAITDPEARRRELGEHLAFLYAVAGAGPG